MNDEESTVNNTNSGLYTISNTVSGNMYMGSSANMNDRMNHHRRDLINGVHGNQHLQHAWGKYGQAAFEFSVFTTCALPRLRDAEQILLDMLFMQFGKERLYNIMTVVDALPNTKGRPKTFDERLIRSEANLGRKRTKEEIRIWKLYPDVKYGVALARYNKERRELKPKGYRQYGQEPRVDKLRRRTTHTMPPKGTRKQSVRLASKTKQTKRESLEDVRNRIYKRTKGPTRKFRLDGTLDGSNDLASRY